MSKKPGAAGGLPTDGCDMFLQNISSHTNNTWRYIPEDGNIHISHSLANLEY
jgi:hypothetical protein